MAIPLIPAFDKPITKAAVKASTHAVVETLKTKGKVTDKVYGSKNKSILIYFIFRN